MGLLKKTVKKCITLAGYDIVKKRNDLIITHSKFKEFNYSEIINKVLSSEFLIKQPPVLVDVGASGGINEPWIDLAKYSIAIGFDADDREMDKVKNQKSAFKKLIIINKLVADKEFSEHPFYLTKSPFCSSMLRPDEVSLENWNYADLFTVEREEKFSSTTLSKILEESNLSYVDWIKTDSQGIDLRIVDSLDQNVRDRLLSIEYEPGILNSYVGEDKLSKIMFTMESKPYWMTKLFVKGASRVSMNDIEKTLGGDYKEYFKYGKEITHSAPGWAEVEYLREFDDNTRERDLLLITIFALIQKQEGYALRASLFGIEKFRNPLFNDIKESIEKVWRAKIN